MPFQSPMGIGITSNRLAELGCPRQQEFQSPMGIGITSNNKKMKEITIEAWVSIPNGDRHYLEQRKASE